MKKVLAVIIALIVGLAGGFGGGIYYLKNAQKDPKPTIDIEILKEEIKEISELATCQDTYKATVPYSTESKKFWKTDINIPLSSKSMVAEYSATIKLGLKLTDDNYDIRANEDSITVTIPHSEILSHEIDEDSWELKDKKNGLFNPLKPEDDSELRKLAKKQVSSKLDMDALYQKADENAQEQIQKFLELSNPEATVVVEFK